MIRICIEKISDGESSWVTIPNGDLKTAISDISEGKDWKVSMVLSSLTKNCFDLVNLIEFNELLIELEESHHFDSNDVSNLSLLNIILEDRNYSISEARDVIINEGYRIYRNAKDMGDVAREYLENTSHEFNELLESDSLLVKYIDFKAYGQEALEPNGSFFIDEYNELIIELY